MTNFSSVDTEYGPSEPPPVLSPPPPPAGLSPPAAASAFILLPAFATLIGAVRRRLLTRSPDDDSCASFSSGMRPHPLDHLLDMRDRGFRLDTVAEIEDQPAFGVIRQHVVDRPVERSAAGDQRQRVEIALDRHAVLHVLADQYRVGRPVDADRVDAGCLH